jgi:hypothetical protein
MQRYPGMTSRRPTLPFFVNATPPLPLAPIRDSLGDVSNPEPTNPEAVDTGPVQKPLSNVLQVKMSTGALLPAVPRFRTAKKKYRQRSEARYVALEHPKPLARTGVGGVGGSVKIAASYMHRDRFPDRGGRAVWSVLSQVLPYIFSSRSACPQGVVFWRVSRIIISPPVVPVSTPRMLACPS